MCQMLEMHDSCVIQVHTSTNHVIIALSYSRSAAELQCRWRMTISQPDESLVKVIVSAASSIFMRRNSGSSSPLSLTLNEPVGF